MDNVLICKKLKTLLKYYRELQEYTSGLTQKAYLNQSLVRRAIERQIQLTVECGTDVNNMILKKLNQSPATDYYNSFIDLAELGVLDMNFAMNIAPSTGLRNILIHEYTEIDDVIVYNSIEKILHNYGQYLKIICDYLKC